MIIRYYHWIAFLCFLLTFQGHLCWPTLQPATSVQPLKAESDTEESRRVLGSSVVTSVSVVTDHGNGTKTLLNEALDRAELKTNALGSPIHMINPDRYEFYTFDETGDLIKRLMTWDEIQGLIAGGDTDGILGEESIPIYYNEPLTSNSGHITASELQSSDVHDVHKVVESVQNVLKSELAASQSKTPTIANSDIGSNVPNWSLFLPELLESMDENSGDLNHLPNYASPDPTVIMKHAPSASITSSSNDILNPTTNAITLSDKPNRFITTTAKSANPSRYPPGKPYFPPLTIKTPGISSATPSSSSKTSYLTTSMYPSTSPFTKDMLSSYSHVLSQVSDISKLSSTTADESTSPMTSKPSYEPTVTFKTTNVQNIKDVSALSQKLPSSSTALSISTTPITFSSSQVVENQSWLQSTEKDVISTNTMIPSESNTLTNSFQHVTTILQQDNTNTKSAIDKTSTANHLPILYSPLEDIASTKYSTTKYKPKPDTTSYHESTRPIGADFSSSTLNRISYKPKPDTSHYESTRPTGADLSSSSSKYKPKPDTTSHYESTRPIGIDQSSTTKYKPKPDTSSLYESTRPIGIDQSSTTKYKPKPDTTSYYELTRPLTTDILSSTTKYKPKPDSTPHYDLTRPFGTTDLLSLFDLKNITLEKTTIPDGDKLVTEQYVWNKISQTTPPSLKTTSIGSYNYTRISTTNKIPDNYTNIFHEHKITNKYNEKVTDRLPTVNYGISDFIDIQNKLSSSTSTTATSAETKPILTTFSSATPTSFFSSTNSGTIHENIKYTTVTSHKTTNKKNNTLKYPTNNNNRYKHPVTTTNYNQNSTKTNKPTKKPISYTKITSSSSDKFNIPGVRNTSQSTPVFMQRIPTINPPEKKRPLNHTTKGNNASSKNRTQIAIMLNNNENKIDEKNWQKVDSNTQENYKNNNNNNIKPGATNTIKQIDNIIQNGITAVTNVLLHSEGRISNNNLLEDNNNIIENNNSLSETLSPENRTLDEENISQSTVIIEINNHSTTPPASSLSVDQDTNNATDSMLALGDNLTIQVPTMQESTTTSESWSKNTTSTESIIDSTMTENISESSSATESTSQEGTEASSVASSTIVSESNNNNNNNNNNYLANDTRNNNYTIDNNNTSEFNEPKTVITSNSTATNVSGPLTNDKDTGRTEDIESNLQNDSVQSTENSSQMITLYSSSTQESQESRISSTESSSSELSSEEVTSIKTTTTQTPVHLNPAPHESMGLESSTKFLSDDIKRFIDLCNELSFRTWTSHSGKGFITSRSMVMSPFAAISTLAMVFLGARGSSSGQMNDFLKLDDMVTFNPHQVFQNITESVIGRHIDGVASSAFVREIFSDMSKGKILDFYKERVQQYYDSHVEEINFNIIGDLVRRRTNLIVKRQTMGRIQDFLRGSGLVLKPPLAAFTANIFQTNCDIASTDGRDGEMYFVVRPSTRQRRLVPIPAVVYREGFLAGYEPGIDATAVSLNSDSIVSTILVLPGQQGQVAPGDGLSRLEQRLLESSFRRGAWSRLLRSLLPRSGLELQIPRFSHRSVLNLTAGLQKMGLGDIFASDRADLRGINGLSNDLYLSDLIQANMFSTCGEEIIGARHHVETYPSSPQRVGRLFEDNHEDIIKPLDTPMNAHSLLPLNMRPRQARLPDNPRLRFDRPFLYMVRHNPTGSILYIGRFNPRLLP